MIPILAAAILSCAVIDGDTIRCGPPGQAKAERVRLTGVDAPELHGCPRGRSCAPGDGAQSRATLRRIIGGRPVRLIRLGRDHYGRTLGIVHVGGENAACAMLRTGQAVYVARWDTGGHVARDCGDKF